LRLDQAAHDVDGGIVAVKQGSSSDKPQRFELLGLIPGGLADLVRGSTHKIGFLLVGCASLIPDAGRHDFSGKTIGLTANCTACHSKKGRLSRDSAPC